MVRLVFRPYTQVWRTICTSVPLRASIRVSPDFTLLKHSSPSFGSDPYRSYSNLSQEIKVGRLCKTEKSKLLLSFRVQVYHPHTRDRGRLLGPCFKTGRKKPFSHRRRTTLLTLIKAKKPALQKSRNSSLGLHASERYPPSYIGVKVSDWKCRTPRRTNKDRRYYLNTQYTMTRNSEKHHNHPAQLNCPCGTETHLRKQQSRN